jgi:hypothetical protein
MPHELLPCTKKRRGHFLRNPPEPSAMASEAAGGKRVSARKIGGPDVGGASRAEHIPSARTRAQPSATAAGGTLGNTLDDVTNYLERVYPDMTGNVQVVTKPAASDSTLHSVSYHAIRAHKEALPDEDGGAGESRHPLAPNTRMLVMTDTPVASLSLAGAAAEGTAAVAAAASAAVAAVAAASAAGGTGNSIEVDEPADAQWPAATSVLCHHCAHSFETMPLPIPTGRTHTNARKYLVTGTFCGLPCALRYIEIHGGHNAEEQKLMLRQMAKDVFHMRDAFKAHAAGDAVLLKAFGGPMSISQFRDASNSKGVKLRTLTAPLVHAHMVVEQRGVTRPPASSGSSSSSSSSSMLCSAVRNISRPVQPVLPPTPNIRGQGLYEDFVRTRQNQQQQHGNTAKSATAAVGSTSSTMAEAPDGPRFAEAATAADGPQPALLGQLSADLPQQLTAGKRRGVQPPVLDAQDSPQATRPMPPPPKSKSKLGGEGLRKKEGGAKSVGARGGSLESHPPADEDTLMQFLI